jgi:hypothetical protein
MPNDKRAWVPAGSPVVRGSPDAARADDRRSPPHRGDLRSAGVARSGDRPQRRPFVVPASAGTAEDGRPLTIRLSGPRPRQVRRAGARRRIGESSYRAPPPEGGTTNSVWSAARSRRFRIFRTGTDQPRQTDDPCLLQNFLKRRELARTPDWNGNHTGSGVFFRPAEA